MAASVTTVERPTTSTGEPMVGRRIPRREDERFLRGAGAYVDDLELPHMLHVSFVRSPFAHAQLGGIDPAEALSLPGVHAVIDGKDLRAACSGPLAIEVTLERDEVRTCTQPVLPVDRVRFVGEPVAMVVADSRYTAEDGAERVLVDWEPLDVIADAAAALSSEAVALHPEIPDNSFAHIEYAHGDVAGAFEHAAHVFSKRFDVGRWHANPLEPRGIVANHAVWSDEYELWSSCQSPHGLRALMGLITGIPEHRLRVHAPDVGGAFGPKGSIFPEDPAMLVAAKIVGRPLKWIEDRVEHLAATSHAKQMEVELELAVDEDGRFLAFRGKYLGDAGAYAQLPPTPLTDVLQAAVMMPSLYGIEAIEYELASALTNKGPAAAARGVGWSSGQMVRETLIDEAARALDLDPVEIRVRNCLGPEPRKTVTGLSYDGGSYAESLERLAEEMDYPALRSRQAELRERGRFLGIGISPFIEPSAYGTIHARAVGLGGATFDTLSITVESDGSIVVRSGFSSQGQGHETTLAQVAADAIGVPIETIRLIQGDTDGGSFGFGAFGSRGAAIGSELILLAASDLRAKLFAIAAHLLGAAADEIELARGVLRVQGDAERAMSLHDLAGAVYYGGPETKPAGLDPTLSVTRHYDPPESYTNGAIGAVVEVDAETGIVSPQGLWIVEDCGVMLNPMVVEGQLAGGAAQGVGMALLEELVYDEECQLNSGTLMDYLYPTTAEVPPMWFEHLETQAAGLTSGVKGAGEGAAVAAPAAILQAVADALAPFGARIERSPLRPDHVLALIGDDFETRARRPEGRRTAEAS